VKKPELRLERACSRRVAISGPSMLAPKRPVLAPDFGCNYFNSAFETLYDMNTVYSIFQTVGNSWSAYKLRVLYIHRNTSAITMSSFNSYSTVKGLFVLGTTTSAICSGPSD
jgi:hypothetical protein